MTTANSTTRRLLRAAGYIRMSSGKQERSPAQQKGEITKLAKAEACKVVLWFSDEAITGDSGDAERPGFRDMLEAAEAGLFEVLLLENADGPHRLSVFYIVCPNESCRKFTLQVVLSALKRGEDEKLEDGETTLTRQLVPASEAKVFPNYIPEPVIADYNEACLIRDLSPKAAATLARRALQGIIRDFWDVKASRLADEIEQIQDKVHTYSS